MWDYQDSLSQYNDTYIKAEATKILLSHNAMVSNRRWSTWVLNSHNTIILKETLQDTIATVAS